MTNRSEFTRAVDFSHVVLLGRSSSQIQRHAKAWRLAGIDPKALKSGSKITDKLAGALLDVCDSPERARILQQALRTGLNVVVTESADDDPLALREFSEEFARRDLALFVIDPLRHHPLVESAKQLISENKVGVPRLLRMEFFGKERGKNLNVVQNLFYGLRASELLLEPFRVTRVYASKIKTRYASFFAVLASLKNEATVHLVAGTSTKNEKFEFALNGTGGMISSVESEAVVLSDSLRTPNNLISAYSTEILFRTFSSLTSGRREPPRFRTAFTQTVLRAVLDSAESGIPIQVKE